MHFWERQAYTSNLGKSGAERNLNNQNCNLKKENNININLTNTNQLIKKTSFKDNNKISVDKEKNKMNYEELKEVDNLEKNKIQDNISIDLNDILEEINSIKIENNKFIQKYGGIDKLNPKKIKSKKFNLKKYINKNNNISKEGKAENIIEQAINTNTKNNINEITDISNHNKQKFNQDSKNENYLNEEELTALPDLSYIRNKLNISIIKRMKINEDELE